MPDTSFTDYVTTIVSTWLNQANKLVFWGRRPNVATTTGSANAQILTLETGSLYSAGTEADGDEFVFLAGFTNAAAMTLQVLQPSGTNVARAVQLNGAALTGGEVIAGQPYRVTRKSATWQLTSLAGTAFGTTLLQQATATAARTALDAAQFTSSLTEDTAPDKIADFLHGYDTSAAAEKKLRIITAIARAMPFGQGLLINGKIATSVGSNALTVAVKGDDGNDPSSTNPVYALFRKSTLTDSGFDIVAITSALSVVVSSGSTLGHASALPAYFFVYLINNSGTAELAVSTVPPDYDATFGNTRLVSTTAEGGAGGADSASAIYSTTARSNVAWICVAMLKSTQTTAGTWAAAMTQVDQAPFKIPMPAFRVHRNGTAQNVADNTITVWQGTTEDYDIEGGWNTSSYRFVCPLTGLYSFYGQTRTNFPNDQMYVGALVYKNGGSNAYGQDRMSSSAADQQVRCAATIWLVPGDYVEMRVLHTRGTTEDFNGGSVETFFMGHRL